MLRSLSARQKRVPKSAMEPSGRKKKNSNDEKSMNKSKRGNKGSQSTRMKKFMNNAKPKAPVENPNATPIPQDVENPFIILRNELFGVLTAIKGVVQQNPGIMKTSKAGMKMMQAPEGHDEYEMLVATLSKQKLFDDFENLEKMKQTIEKQAKLHRDHQVETEKHFESAQKFVMDEFNEIAEMHAQLLKVRDEMDHRIALNSEGIDKAKEAFQNECGKLTNKLKEYSDISEKHTDLIPQWMEIHQQYHVAMAKVLEESGVIEA